MDVKWTCPACQLVGLVDATYEEMFTLGKMVTCGESNSNEVRGAGCGTRSVLDFAITIDVKATALRTAQDATKSNVVPMKKPEGQA